MRLGSPFEFIPEYNNPSSPEYMNLNRDITRRLLIAFQNNENVMNLSITGVYPGSVIVA